MIFLAIPMKQFSILGSTICSSQVHAATNPDENVASSTMPYFFVYIGSIYKETSSVAESKKSKMSSKSKK